MTTRPACVDEYRRCMEEALEWARRAKTKEQAEGFIRLAETWQQAALRAIERERNDDTTGAFRSLEC